MCKQDFDIDFDLRIGPRYCNAHFSDVLKFQKEPENHKVVLPVAQCPKVLFVESKVSSNALDPNLHTNGGMLPHSSDADVWARSHNPTLRLRSDLAARFDPSTMQSDGNSVCKEVLATNSILPL